MHRASLRSTLMTLTERYDKVNALWPAEVPPLTFNEAVRAVAKLTRMAGAPIRGAQFIQTSGNRYNWIRRYVCRLNPGRGWKELVHDISHWVHMSRYPGSVPHQDRRHATIEARMVRVVVARGWLTGALRVQPKVVEPMDPVEAKRLERAHRIELREAQVRRLEKKGIAIMKRLARARRSLTALRRAEQCLGDRRREGAR